MLKVKANWKPLKRELNKMKKEMNKIQAQSNTQLARDAGSAIKKEVRKEYNIPAKELTAKKGGVVQLWHANTHNIAAKLITRKGKGVKLIKFKGLPRTPQGSKPVDKRTPTKVTVKKGRTKILKSAFVAIMKSGHKGIFERKENSHNIKEQYGPSAHDLYQSKRTRTFVKQFVKKNYQRIFKSKYDYVRKRTK